jgi:hypothetical protein
MEGLDGWEISTHNCMRFPVTDGRSEIVVRGRVHAHDAKTVAGVIRVQKMDLVVDKVASTNLCHGSCGHCRETVQICETRGRVWLYWSSTSRSLLK